MKAYINIPNNVNTILTILKDEGFEAFVVGGCVRDSLRGVTPFDWDICTSAKPQETINIFKNKYTTVPTGIKHGTVTIIVDKDSIEVTSYRTDGNYYDNRHPKNVIFVNSIEKDLKRRDFTVNAMAYNNDLGIIDLFNGYKDIENKIIRCVGDANTRFEEDALRIIRAIRFSAVCGYTIEEKTNTAIFNKQSLLKNIAVERIFTELKKILLADNIYGIFKNYSDVFETAISCQVDKKNLILIDKLPKSISLRFCALFGVNALVALKNLKADNILKNQVTAIVNNFKIPEPDTKQAVKLMLKQYGEDNCRNIFIFNNFSNAQKLLEEIVKNNECYSLKDLSINGRDLISLNIADGSKIGFILEQLLINVINNEIENNRAELVKSALKYK